MINAVRKFFGSDTDILVNNIRRLEQENKILTGQVERLRTQRVEAKPVAVLPEEVKALYDRIDFLRSVISNAAGGTIDKEMLKGALISDSQSKV